MIDTDALKEAIKNYENSAGHDLGGLPDADNVALDCMRLVLASQAAEDEVEAIADAVNRARYHAPHGYNMTERGVAEEGPSCKEYAYRLARAALLAANLKRGTLDAPNAWDEGAKAMREACAKAAQKHKHRSRLPLGKFDKYSRDEIRSEQRGEDIAADIIASTILSLPLPPQGQRT